MAMESAVIRSPPTSRAMAARSWVAVITLILDAAWEGTAASRSAAIAEYFLNMWIGAFRAELGSTQLVGTMLDAGGVTGELSILEGVRSVGAHGELELEENFVGGQSFAIFGAPELGADQAELAGHVGQLKTATRVLKEGDGARIGGQRIVAGCRGCRGGGQAIAALGAVEAAAEDPAPVDLIVAGNVETEGLGEAAGRAGERRSRRPGEIGRRDAGARPDQLAARHEGVINGAPQGFPAQRDITAEELILAVGEGTVAARIRCPEIDVGGFGEIAVGAQMAHGGHVAAPHGGEHVVAVAAEDLRCAFQEESLGRREDAAQREARIVDAVFAAHQVLAHQR